MAQPQFPVVRRGYEPKAVDTVLEDLRDRIAHAEATTHAARTYSASILTELRRLQTLEDELTTSLELARRTAAAIVADAHEQASALIAAAEAEAGARLAVAEIEAVGRTRDAEAEARRTIIAADDEAARTLAEGRARLAIEAAEMEKYRLAIVAEASMLAQIEQRLGPRLSRAAARLVEVVDATDGIGPFSHATAELVHFARLLQRSIAAGTFDAVDLEIDGGNAALRISTRAIDLRDGEPMVPIGQDHGTVPVALLDAQENAANISSMALS